MDAGRGVNIGCDRCFCIAFNNKFPLLLISSYQGLLTLISPRWEKGARHRLTHPPVIFYFKNF